MATINRSPLSIGPVLGLTDQADIRELARTLSPTYDAKREYLLSASRMAVTTTALVVGWQPLHVVPAGRQWRILSGVSHLVYTSGAFPITQVLIADAQGQNVAVGDTNVPWVIAAAASGLPVLPNHALTAPAAPINNQPLQIEQTARTKGDPDGLTHVREIEKLADQEKRQDEQAMNQWFDRDRE